MKIERNTGTKIKDLNEIEIENNFEKLLLQFYYYQKIFRLNYQFKKISSSFVNFTIVPIFYSILHSSLFAFITRLRSN